MKYCASMRKSIAPGAAVSWLLLRATGSTLGDCADANRRAIVMEGDVARPNARCPILGRGHSRPPTRFVSGVRCVVPRLGNLTAVGRWRTGVATRPSTSRHVTPSVLPCSGSPCLSRIATWRSTACGVRKSARMTAHAGQHDNVAYVVDRRVRVLFCTNGGRAIENRVQNAKGWCFLAAGRVCRWRDDETVNQHDPDERVLRSPEPAILHFGVVRRQNPASVDRRC
jgi:hypothetical protein